MTDLRHVLREVDERLALNATSLNAASLNAASLNAVQAFEEAEGA